MEINTERTASSLLGTAPYSQITATVPAVKFDHRSMGLPKRINHSIKNLGECTSRFVRTAPIAPLTFIVTGEQGPDDGVCGVLEIFG